MNSYKINRKTMPYKYYAEISKAYEQKASDCTYILWVCDLDDDPPKNDASLYGALSRCISKENGKENTSKKCLLGAHCRNSKTSFGPYDTQACGTTPRVKSPKEHQSTVPARSQSWARSRMPEATDCNYNDRGRYRWVQAEPYAFTAMAWQTAQSSG